MNIDIKQLRNAKNVQVNVCNEDMSAYEAARWLALLEGIDFIDKTASRMKVDLSDQKSWVKPLAFQKYINERTYGMVAEIYANEKCTTS